MTIKDTLLYRNRKLHLVKILMFIIFSLFTWYFLNWLHFNYVVPAYQPVSEPLKAELFDNVFLFRFLVYIPGFSNWIFLHALNFKSFFDEKSSFLYFVAFYIHLYVLYPFRLIGRLDYKIPILFFIVYLFELIITINSRNNKVSSHLKYIMS